jgi:acyl-CoA thioesterase FadM
MESRVSQVKKASFAFDYRPFLYGDPELRVAGRTLHVTLDFGNRVVKIPAWPIDIIGPG